MQVEDGDGWWDDDCPLPDVPPVDLPEDAEPEDVDALEEIIRLDRGHHSLEGHRALWVLALLRTTTPRAGVSARDLVAAEIGPALGLGSGAAVRLVELAVALRERLPATLRAACDGDLSWHKATILAEAVAPLTDAQARRVEQMVLAKAGARTPAQHADAVRRAVAQVDPEGADARRRQQRKDVRFLRTHYGDGMGELFARMTSEQLDIIFTAADFWARTRKAQGDPRTLDQLRIAALVQAMQSLLHHNDPTYCERWCQPGSHGGPVAQTDDDDSDSDDGGRDEGPSDDGPSDDGPGDDGDEDGGDGPDDNAADSADDRDGEGADDDPVPGSDVEPADDVAAKQQPPASTPPTRHGRPAALHAFWDLTSLLGLTRHCGELTDSGAMMPPDAMRELVAGGVAIRRMLLDPDTGHLVDLTPRTWKLPRTRRTDLDAPVVLGVTLTTEVWRAIQDGSADPHLLQAIAATPQAVRDLLAHPWTAEDLDNTPRAYPAPTRLAEFIAMRDRHPTNPTAGPTAASAADIEHVTPHTRGGTSTRDGLTTNVRRWHRFKTNGGWTVTPHEHGWKWTSPRGRSYCTEPYDYRLGP